MHVNLWNGWITWLSAKQKHFECIQTKQMRNLRCRWWKTWKFFIHALTYIIRLFWIFLNGINVFWFLVVVVCFRIIKCELRPFTVHTAHIKHFRCPWHPLNVIDVLWLIWFFAYHSFIIHGRMRFFRYLPRIGIPLKRQRQCAWELHINKK